MQSCTDVATLVSKFSTYNLSVFVCFKQKTAYETRISDWSSDVCSSDLCSKPSNDSALENRKPCPQRQPSLSKADRCSSVSIPSAMTSSLSPRLSVINERTIATAPGSLGSPRTKLWSIFISSRSDERRVGTDCVLTFRSRWSLYHYNKLLYLSLPIFL